MPTTPFDLEFTHIANHVVYANTNSSLKLPGWSTNNQTMATNYTGMLEAWSITQLIGLPLTFHIHSMYVCTSKFCSWFSKLIGVSLTEPHTWCCLLNLVWCHSVTFSQVSLGLWVRLADQSYLTSSSPFSKGGSLPLSPAMLLLFSVLLCSLVLWRSISLLLHRTFVLPLLASSEFTSSVHL